MPSIFYDQRWEFCTVKMHGKRRESPVAAMSGSNAPIELPHGSVCSLSAVAHVCRCTCRKIRGPSVLRDINASEDNVALARTRISRQLRDKRWVRDRGRAGLPKWGNIYILRSTRIKVLLAKMILIWSYKQMHLPSFTRIPHTA
jgi:hypothetical protein